MKFRFNGGLDCPEWILSQIPEIAKINASNLQQLCATIVERVKVKKLEWTEKDLSNLCENGTDAAALRKLKAIIAALCFIFEKSAKNDCSAHDLEKEMLQLGLPSENVSVLSEIFEVNQKLLMSSTFAEPPLKAPSLKLIRKEPLQIAACHPNAYIKMQTLSSDGTQMSLIVEKEQMNRLKQSMESTVKQLEMLKEK